MVQFTVTSEKLLRALDRAPGQFRKEIENGLNTVGADTVAQITQRIQLNRRTGNLANSLGWVVTGQDRLSSMRLTVFSAGVPYARIQEYGGTIYPKNVSRLSIPTDSNRVGAGSLRFPNVQTAIQAGAQVLPVMRGARKNVTSYVAFLERRPNGGQRVRDIVFLLAKQATIPGPKSTGDRSRFGFFDTWENSSVKDRRNKIMSRAWFRAAGSLAK